MNESTTAPVASKPLNQLTLVSSLKPTNNPYIEGSRKVYKTVYVTTTGKQVEHECTEAVWEAQNKEAHRFHMAKKCNFLLETDKQGIIVDIIPQDRPDAFSGFDTDTTNEFGADPNSIVLHVTPDNIKVRMAPERVGDGLLNLIIHDIHGARGKLKMHDQFHGYKVSSIRSDGSGDHVILGDAKAPK